MAHHGIHSYRTGKKRGNTKGGRGGKDQASTCVFGMAVFGGLVFFLVFLVFMHVVQQAGSITSF